MKTHKTLRLRQYIVEAVDRRTGQRITDTIVYERGTALLLGTYDTDVTDAINRQYSRKGYRVTNIARGAACACRVELGALFDGTAEIQPTGATG